MNKLYALLLTTSIMLVSCGPNKELVAAQVKLKNTQDLLNTATVKLNSCLTDKAVSDASLNALISLSRHCQNKSRHCTCL